jgi:hypothetical protein
LLRQTDGSGYGVIKSKRSIAADSGFPAVFFTFSLFDSEIQRDNPFHSDGIGMSQKILLQHIAVQWRETARNNGLREMPPLKAGSKSQRSTTITSSPIRESPYFRFLNSFASSKSHTYSKPASTSC